MSAEEKSDKLIEKYYKLFSVGLENTISQYEAVHCAIICVEEILYIQTGMEDSVWYENSRTFYKEVKTILENKLK